MSALNWRLNAQLYSGFTPTDTVIGTYQGADGGLSVVSFGSYTDDDSGTSQSAVSVKSVTRYRPWPGEAVILTWIKGNLRLTGPASTYSATGTISQVGNPYVHVFANGKEYMLPYAVSLTGDLVVNDIVTIDWDAGGYVKDKVTAPPLGPDQPPKLTTNQKPFTLYFFAKQSGSRKSFNPPGAAPAYRKWWTQDVIADDDNVAAWFYGSILRKTLRDDAYISSVEVYMPLRSAKGGLPKIGRHSKDTRPPADDTFTVSDAATRKSRSGWVRLPVEWAETWRSNPGGVALDGGGTNIYKGIQANRQSGKLRIRGRQ